MQGKDIQCSLNTNRSFLDESFDKRAGPSTDLKDSLLQHGFRLAFSGPWQSVTDLLVTNNCESLAVGTGMDHSGSSIQKSIQKVI